MRVFVDTGTDRLGTLVDRFKSASSSVFATLHRWDWLDAAAPALRLALLGTLLAAALCAVLAGLRLYVARSATGSARLRLRRVHRLAGIAVSIPAAAFLSSGLYHLLHLGVRGDPAARVTASPARIESAALRIGFAEAIAHARIDAPARVSLAEIDGRAYYRVQPPTPRDGQSGQSGHSGHFGHSGHAGHAGHAAHAGRATPSTVALAQPVYVSAADGALLADGEQRYAASIATRALGTAVGGAITPVTAFAGEYGFVFKRLPVQRVPLAGAGAPTAYVDTADGRIAALIDDADRREGWVFAYVHKHDWLVPLVGRDVRDAVAVLLALSVAGTATLGGVLFARRRRRAPTGAFAGPLAARLPTARE
jgi:hypothetical protein